MRNDAARAVAPRAGLRDRERPLRDAHLAGAAARLRIDAGMAELVIGGALGRLAEHLVGFLRLLEMLLGARILRIAVRMPFHGEAPIRLLHVFFRGVAVDAEDFVVIALRHS